MFFDEDDIASEFQDDDDIASEFGDDITDAVENCHLVEARKIRTAKEEMDRNLESVAKISGHIAHVSAPRKQ